MKKSLILAGLFVAIASYGGFFFRGAVANAQAALTPQDQSNLQQSLDVLKAKLANLQMQQGMVPQGDDAMALDAGVSASAAPQASLSASDVAMLQQALTALASMLTNLQAKITSDPQFIASANEQSVMAELEGINATLVAIGTQIVNGNIAMAPAASAPAAVSAPAQAPASAPVAVRSQTTAPAAGSRVTANTPSTNLGANLMPSTQNAPAGQTPAPAAATPAANANSAPQTAQASSFSFGKLNWPLIVVIVLVVAAIAIWLFWDTEEEKPTTVKTVANAPQKPMQPFAMPTPSAPTAGSASGSQSPLSSTLGPQQRKSA